MYSCYRFNVQSGLWRDSYGEPKGHDTAVRGVSSDNLNQIVISGGSDSRIKFWKFNNKGNDMYLLIVQAVCNQICTI